MSNKTNEEQRKEIFGFMTSKGSKYTLLPDLTFQRFKTIAQELHRPHQVTVFIPPHEVLIKSGEKYGREKGIIGNSKLETESNIEDMIIFGYKAQIVVDKVGRHINSVRDLLSCEQPFIMLSNSPKDTIYIPVGVIPKFGWRVYENSFGKSPQKRRTHLGNEITQISYRS